MIKPFTSTVKEAETLIDLAKKKNLLLFEAITTLHFPNYNKLKQQIGALGKLKLVQCNYSQCSSFEVGIGNNGVYYNEQKLGRM